MRYRLTIAAGIFIAVATALSAQPVYRLHDDGELSVSRAETCDGQPCTSWHLLDNNPKTREVTAGGAPADTPPLYQRHADGSIWRYTGKPCCDGACPGWQRIDNDGRTVSIVAAGPYLYKRHSDGAIWRYDGTWRQLDDNRETAAVTAGGIPERTELYQRRNDGSVWRFTGTEWEMLDNNRRTRELTATVRKRSDGTLVQALYQRDGDNRI